MLEGTNNERGKIWSEEKFIVWKDHLGWRGVSKFVRLIIFLFSFFLVFSVDLFFVILLCKKGILV